MMFTRFSSHRSTHPDRSGYRNGYRWAFTLVELLIVIVLITVVGSMISVALTSVRQTARIQRTRGELLNMGQLLQNRLASITFAKLEPRESFSVQTAAFASGWGADNGETPSEIESDDQSRRNMLLRRDFARLVLPECQADLLMPPATIQARRVDTTSTTSPARMFARGYKVVVPPVWDDMRSLAGLKNSIQIDAAGSAIGLVNSATSADVDSIGLFQGNATFRTICSTDTLGNAVNWTREYESAECLYLILATYQSNGQFAIDQIPKRNITNLDGDRVPEIVDAWGTPIRFLRSPVGGGRDSWNNWNPDRIGTDSEFTPEPDPYDFLLTDWRFDPDRLDLTAGSAGSPFRDAEAYHPVYVPPVIISAGADGEFGVLCPEDAPEFFSTSAVAMTPAPAPRVVAGNAVMTYRYPDPYFNVSSVLGGGAFVLSGNSNPPFAGTVRAKVRGDLAPGQTATGSNYGGDYIGGGYGGVIASQSEAAGDNITSLDDV